VRVLAGDPLDWNATSNAGSAVSIGVFDGVHRGHQEVLADLAVQADARGGLQRVVLTFDPHPLALLTPGHEPPLIGSLSQRLDWLAAEGVDLVGVLPFEQIRLMEAADFVEQILVKSLGTRVVVVGMDFRYGRGRDGTIETLIGAGSRLGFAVDAVPLLTEHDGALSSSNVRILVQQGEVEAAAEVLARPFAVRGEVVEGDRRGRGIGFPTANLRFDAEVLIPKHGVYATLAEIDRQTYPSVTNVGVRPTFDGHIETVETHLLDVDLDLYGKTIDVHFISSIRPEQKFGDVEALVTQITADVREARFKLTSPE